MNMDAINLDGFRGCLWTFKVTVSKNIHIKFNKNSSNYIEAFVKHKFYIFGKT